MQKHTRIYMDYFGYDLSDFIPCEICERPAADTHHIIYKSQGGKDEAGNLMALCRDCHITAHSEYYPKNFLQNVHNKFITK